MAGMGVVGWSEMRKSVTAVFILVTPIANLLRELPPVLCAYCERPSKILSWSHLWLLETEPFPNKSRKGWLSADRARRRPESFTWLFDI